VQKMKDIGEKMRKTNPKKKQWYKCNACKHYYDCSEGRQKTQNFDSIQRSILDVGCYNYNSYYNSTRQQLSLSLSEV